MGGMVSQIGAMTGIGSSPASQGLGWTPGQVGMQNPVTGQQATDAYTAAQSGIKGQQDFLTALQGQNGIANQSSVFNQLQGVANGTGPNPAQAMLAQSTGANTANQAALMAGQRGAGANAGLIARQAAQQGGANQQMAAGQGATMQANQSLNALNQLGGIAGTQVGQQAAATGAVTGAQMGEQQMLLNQINQQNNTGLAQQQGINAIQAQQAQAGSQAQQGLLSGASKMAGMPAMAQGGRVMLADGGGYSQVPNSSDAPPAGAFGQIHDTSMGGPPQAMNNQYAVPTSKQPSGAPQAPAAPKNPLAPSQGTAAPGTAPPTNPWLANTQSAAFQGGSQLGSGLGSAIKSLFTSSGNGTAGGGAGNQGGYQPTSPQNLDWGKAPSQDINPAAANGDWANLAHGGKVPAMVSPGERYLNPREVDKVAEGKKAAISAGEKIPGKAKVKGDSLKNDTVPKTLEEGGIVLPKSVMESKHPHWAAHKFVSNILAQQQGQLRSKKK